MMRLTLTSSLVLIGLLFQASTPSTNAFVVPSSLHHGASSSSFLLRVYTPEQEADEKMRLKDSSSSSSSSSSTSDQVLQSLTEKLDKSAATAASKKKDNKAMAFLRKMGKVGGAANKDFANAVGSDEGSGMAAPKNTASTANASSSSSSSPRKSVHAYQECTTSGVIDDMTDSFPLTSSGTEWRGVSDRVRGGNSDGSIQREEVDGRTANVLKGHVSLAPQGGGGFIQMVTDLPMDPSKPSVDASDFDGIEMDVLSREGLEFNVHLRTPGSLQQASYRHTQTLEVLFSWQTIRIPFSKFVAVGDGQETVDYSKLKRIGIVVIDQETDVELAVGGVRFYSVF